MTDINKLIEEEASWYRQRVYQERVVLSDSYVDSVDIALAVKHGASFIIHHYRWRKVSEELPDKLTDVLIKDSFGKIDIGCLYDNGIWGMTPPTDRKITEWKPIE